MYFKNVLLLKKTFFYRPNHILLSLFHRPNHILLDASHRPKYILLPTKVHFIKVIHSVSICKSDSYKLYFASTSV
jgi:hypothetical protein